MEDAKMPLTEHLNDLRKAIIKSLLALLFAFLISFTYSEKIVQFIMFPLKYNFDFSVREMYISIVPHDKLKDTKLVFLGPAEAFWMNIKISLFSGIIFSLPVIFHQLWKFVSPGLLPNEKRYVLPFIFSATGLFLFGSSFCFFIVLPFAMEFLLTYKVGDFLMPMLSIGQYVDFCLKFVLAFGAVFELPIIILFLTKMGLLTTKTLAKNRKYAVLAAFVIAALLTPTPDALNQTLMALPIIVLYELSIWISPLFEKKKVQRD